MEIADPILHKVTGEVNPSALSATSTITRPPTAPDWRQCEVGLVDEVNLEASAEGGLHGKADAHHKADVRQEQVIAGRLEAEVLDLEPAESGL